MPSILDVKEYFIIMILGVVPPLIIMWIALWVVYVCIVDMENIVLAIILGGYTFIKGAQNWYRPLDWWVYTGKY